MKVALTVWEDRISPVFDAASVLLMAEIRDGSVSDRQMVPFNPEASWRLAEILKEMGVSILICGAISEVPANFISVSGIELIPFISGETEKILDAYAKGDSITAFFSMPGVRKQCCRRSNKPGRDGIGPQGQGAGKVRDKGRCKTGAAGQIGKGSCLGRGQRGKDGQGQGRQADKQ